MTISSFHFFNIIVSFVFLNACQSNVSNSIKQKSEPAIEFGIDLENRLAYTLPADLDEISGHTFVPGNDDLVYCVQDEDGIVFVFNLKTKKIEFTLPFAKKGDYEGITNDGTNLYVLRSDGTIYSFPIDSRDKQIKPKVFKDLLGKGEYESLGVDTVHKKLVVLCKSCKIDRKKPQLTGYKLDYTTEADVHLAQTFTVDLKLASAIYSKFPKVFNPSAITMNEMTQEWYILSSIDKAILITDSTFKPKMVVPFSRKLYEQPEGIAFDNNGNLYISSEKRDFTSAMLYKIKR